MSITRKMLLQIKLALCLLCLSGSALAFTAQFNSSGGKATNDGLWVFIDDNSQLQVRRLNTSNNQSAGQTYSPSTLPPSSSMFNGIYLRANNSIYGPSQSAIGPGNRIDFNTRTISAVTPANVSDASLTGVAQTATQKLGINNGPQIEITWTYVRPYDFITADVKLTIPQGYSISASNPVRYYHGVDTYLGGSDYGCGVTYTDVTGRRLVGTYPTPGSSSCPTSNTLPPGITIVEAFRERGNAKFSSYCTDRYSNIFNTSSCGIRNSSPMAKTVTTTYVDTGIGIEYDFTTPGVYTFSYDFVVGTPVVPTYDHIEIHHDGEVSVGCSSNVTVMACLVSTVPCPAGSRVVSGSLTGSLTTDTSNFVAFSPSNNFEIGSIEAATIGMRPSHPGEFTIGSNNLSQEPVNGVVCWNRMHGKVGCKISVDDKPCLDGFECIESSASYNNLAKEPGKRNPLYTKLAGQDFKFDVVALNSKGDIATYFNESENLKVELFDDESATRPNCPDYKNPVLSQNISFASAVNGRITIPSPMNVAKAYRELRCRVTNSNAKTTNIYGCSSDTFSVRPQNITSIDLKTTDSVPKSLADANGNDPAKATTSKAGGSLTLFAGTNTVNYSGLPKINNALLEWPASPNSVVVGGVNVGLVGILNNQRTDIVTFAFEADRATGNDARGNFIYNEVGYFRFKAYGVYDDTYVTPSLDIANGDCISASPNVADNFSNIPVNGKYGCFIGNASPSSYFGRFIPDHFNTEVIQACPGKFTYSGQPFPLTVTARTLQDGITQNYAGNYAREVSLTALKQDGSSFVSPVPGALSPATVAANQFVKGVISLSQLQSSLLQSVYSFASPTAPTVIRIRAKENEVTSQRNPLISSIEGITNIKSGRASMGNVVGPEYLDLYVPFLAKYWNGYDWVKNTDDTCTGDTSLPSGTANAVSVSLVPDDGMAPICVRDNGSPGLSGVGCASSDASKRFTKGGQAGFSGDFNLWLSAPISHQRGRVLITGNAPVWLGSPQATVIFGIKNVPWIYRSESY